MSEWERLTLANEENDAEKSELASTPEALHQKFHESADHLHEVRDMHTHVLVQAGMLPESHLADVNPSQRLDWMLKELHGMRDPDGLTIPLRGIASEDLELNIQKNDSETRVQIRIKEEGHEPFERILPLVGNDLEVRAHFANGQLRLRW